jgi:hypothetical protein
MQLPALQVIELAVQSTQAAPPVPQLVSVLAWQRPLLSQQPPTQMDAHGTEPLPDDDALLDEPELLVAPDPEDDVLLPAPLEEELLDEGPPEDEPLDGDPLSKESTTEPPHAAPAARTSTAAQSERTRLLWRPSQRGATIAPRMATAGNTSGPPSVSTG